MKVLFAVSNEEISESIIKRYQKEYKEIISHKNVYYFNAILKELQKDKSYDRVVISEDLEAFTHTQYDQIDKFIFDKLDSISDEASNIKGNDIPIILICSDRRAKSEPMLVKLFGIGIYNAILGNDRSVEEVCRLINRPRVKKEAKLYYKIDSEEVNYQAENENDVSEMEIQNILAHYKSLGKNEDRYIDSFNNIAAQYNDTQLRIISKFLPLNVRAVLEERSPKYQKIMSFNNSVSSSLKYKEKEKEEGTSEKLLKPKNRSVVMTKPVVIPSSVNISGAKKLSKSKQVPQQQNIQHVQRNAKHTPVNDEIIEQLQRATEAKARENVVKPVLQPENRTVTNQPENAKNVSKVAETNSAEIQTKQVKRGRGRPRKNPIPEEVKEPEEKEVKEIQENVQVQPTKKRRGRPRKNPIPEEQEITSNIEEPTILPGFDDIEETTQEVVPEVEENLAITVPGFEDDYEEDTILPGFEDEYEDEESTMLPGFAEEDEEDDHISYGNDSEYRATQANYVSNNNERIEPINNNQYVNNQYSAYNNIGNQIVKQNNEYVQTIDISSLLTADKKIVTFVGTSKNGTSFIVNNVAELLSTMGIKVAILDTTQNRNSYYIYTKNEEALRNIATNCINDLARGTANGINVNQNLTVFTSLPEENEAISNVDEILETLVKNYSVILIDCDFNSPIGYFKQSQETYLVQTLDILTIQPLTAFLRELKAKNILEEKKLKIILNKVVKVRGITEKTIIGGMAFYNDPAMSFMTELFDRNLIKHISIPFEEDIYTKYLEGIINCEITLKGYSKNFMQILKELANMVYPLISGRGTSYRPLMVNTNQTNNTFSPSMNNTLDQMKRRF